MSKRLALFLFIAFFITACSNPLPPSVVTIPEDGLIVLGVIAGSPIDDVRSLQPLADALAGELSQYGITGGQVRVAASSAEMAELLASGEVDLYFDSVYPALLVSEQCDAKFILRGLQFGRPEVHSVIFASQSSGLKSLDELPGKMIVMHTPDSTAGFFLPSAFLAERGHVLTGKDNFSASVSPDEVGFLFSGSDEETLRAVISGSAAVGVVDDYHFDVVFQPEVTQQVVELGRTEALPSQVVLASPGLSESYLSVLAQSLTSLHESESGRAALGAFQTSRFEAFPNGAEMALRRMQEMLAFVKKIPLP